MTPRIVDKRVCPSCGIEQRSTTHPDELVTRCTDCGTSLRPPETVVVTDGFAWHPKDHLEAGAAHIRELVAKIKAKRHEPK